MPQNLIDGFKINSSVPIDDRIIAADSNQRDQIKYKYDGLKVFQIDARNTFIWNQSKYDITGVTSTSWDSDNAIYGQGTFNNIPKWDSYGIGLTHSSIYSLSVSYNEVNQKVGIGGTPSEAFQIYSNYADSALGTSSMPFVIHMGENTTLGSNWYWNIGLLQDAYFNGNFPSTSIGFSGSIVTIKGRTAGSGPSMATYSIISSNITQFSSLKNSATGSVIVANSSGVLSNYKINLDTILHNGNTSSVGVTVSAVEVTGLAGSSTRVVQADNSGNLLATLNSITGFVTDSDIISAIVSATYSIGGGYVSAIVPASSKVFNQGQMYYDSGYLYIAIADNASFRISGS